MNRATSNFNFNKFLDSLKTKLNENEFYFQPLLNGDDESVWLESKTFIVGFFVNDIKKFNILIDLAIEYESKLLCKIMYPDGGEVLEDRVAIDFTVND